MTARKNYFLLALALKLFPVLMLLCGLAVVFSQTSLFNVKEIEVSGSRHYNKETIINFAGINLGENGFRYIGADLTSIIGLRYKQAEKRIMENCPYVKDVTVKYVPPGKVAIVINERKPVCRALYLGTSLLIDREGYVVDALKDGEKSGLPLIKGITIAKYELGRKLEHVGQDALNAAFKVIDEVAESDRNTEFKLLDIIEWVDVSNLREICVFINSGVVINFGDLHELRYRVEVAKHIVFKNLKSGEKGLLDFTESENPVLKQE